MENQEPQSTIVMGHITDIKEKLATNTADTKNIGITLNKMETNLESHNSLFLTHNEFKSFADASSDHEVRLRYLESNVWKAIGVLTFLQIVVLPIVFYLLKN